MANFKLIAPSILALILGGGCFTFLTLSPPQFTAQGSLYVLGPGGDKAGLSAALGGEGSTKGYIVAVASSSTIRENVADRLELWKNDTFWKGRFLGQKGPKKRDRQALRGVFESKVSVSEEEGFVSIKATTEDKVLSQQIAAAMMDGVQSRLKSDGSRKSDSLVNRSKDISSRLKVAEDKLYEFRSKTGLLVEQQLELSTANQSELQRQQLLWKAELAGIAHRQQSTGSLEDTIRLSAARDDKNGAVGSLAVNLRQISESLSHAPFLLRELTRLSRDLRNLSETQAVALTNVEIARVSELEEIQPVRVIDKPSLPDEPDSRLRLRYSLASSCIGFGIGLLFTQRAKIREVIRMTTVAPTMLNHQSS